MLALVIHCYSNFMQRDRYVGIRRTREGCEKLIMEDADVSSIAELEREDDDHYKYDRKGDGSDVLMYSIQEDQIQD